MQFRELILYFCKYAVRIMLTAALQALYVLTFRAIVGVIVKSGSACKIRSHLAFSSQCCTAFLFGMSFFTINLDVKIKKVHIPQIEGHQISWSFSALIPQCRST